MKNFTKQITNKTLFKPTRWLLMALMLLLGTGSAWAGGFWGENAWNIKFYSPNQDKDMWIYDNYDSGHGASATIDLGTFTSAPYLKGFWAKTWGYGNDTNKYVKITFNNTTTSNNEVSKQWNSDGDQMWKSESLNIKFPDTEGSHEESITFAINGAEKMTCKIKYKICATCCTDYYVAGDAGLCGEGWNANADKMDCDDNVWSKTFTGVNNGTYYFQITNGTWDVKKGEFDNSKGNITLSNEDDGYGAKKIKLTTTSKGDITISFDGEKAWVDFAEWGIFLVGDEAQLNLGDVKIGESNEVTLTFRYYGVTGIIPALDAVANYTNDGFSIKAHQDASVAPNKYYDVTIRFAPTQSEGTHKALLNMQYAGGSKKFTLTGNAEQSCQSANVTINDNGWNIPAVMCKNVPATFTYSAEANAAVTWSTDNDKFTIVDNNKTVTVTYTGDAESSNNVLKYTVSETNGFCPEPGVDSGKKLSAQGGVQIEETTKTDQTVCPEGTTTIGVTAGMASYVWKYGKDVMNGKTTNSIEVGAGNYSVTATNANGCVSNVVDFTVTEQEQLITDPFIGIVWGGNTASEITACSEVTLKFWATGATYYEIYENIGLDSDLTNDKKLTEGTISGDGVANAITYDISKNEEGTYKFYAKVSNECTSNTLNNVTLTVPATIAAPGYTLTEPTKCGNSETPGSLAITQVGGISYTINDIVTNNLTLEAADHIQPQTYTITATKTTGSCTRTATTVVTVQTIDNTPVVNDIAITTANTTVCAGSELTLQLDGEAQDGVSFQWYKGSDAIVGATSSSLTIQNVTASDAGDYKLVASKTTPCTVTKESKIITISVDAQSKIEVSAAESFCLGIPVNLTKKVTDATIGEVTWYTDQDGTQVVDNTNITVSANATYYAKAQNGVCPATDAAAYSITAKGATISRTTPAGDIHPYEVTIFTASKAATWELTANHAEGDDLSADDPVFSGKTTAYITKADGATTTFKGETAAGYTISATAEECTTTQTFNVVNDPDNCK